MAVRQEMVQDLIVYGGSSWEDMEYEKSQSIVLNTHCWSLMHATEFEMVMKQGDNKIMSLRI